MCLSTKDIVLMDGLVRIQIKTTLMVALVSVTADKMLDISRLIPKKESALVILKTMDAPMMIYIMTTILIASFKVIIN